MSTTREGIHPRTLCSIAPPDLLGRLAVEGDPRQREAAVRALATSAAIRSQRAVMGYLNRQLNVNIGKMVGFGVIPERRLTIYDNKTNGRTFLPGVRARDWGEPPSRMLLSIRPTTAAVPLMSSSATSTNATLLTALGWNSSHRSTTASPSTTPSGTAPKWFTVTAAAGFSRLVA